MNFQSQSTAWMETQSPSPFLRSGHWTVRLNGWPQCTLRLKMRPAVTRKILWRLTHHSSTLQLVSVVKVLSLCMFMTRFSIQLTTRWYHHSVEALMLPLTRLLTHSQSLVNAMNCRRISHPLQLPHMYVKIGRRFRLMTRTLPMTPTFHFSGKSLVSAWSLTSVKMELVVKCPMVFHGFSTH